MPQNSSTSTSKWILGTAGVLLAALGAFNYWVDPFQQYRPAKQPRFWHSLQRYITPGMAKRGGYDTVLMGSSMFESFRNSEASRYLNGRAVNLSLSAMSAYEAGLMLDVAFRNVPGIKRVVLDLNVNSYAGPPEKRWIDEPLPLYLWDNNPLNDVRYLWSIDTLKRSWDLAQNPAPGGGPPWFTDPDIPWGWALNGEFTRKNAIAGLEPGNFNKRYQQPQRTTEEMIRSFEANILPLIRKHPDTQFDLVHPPYSILAWIDFQQRKQVEVTLEWKRQLFAIASAIPNAAVYDFQSAPVTEDLNNYTDIYHYGMPVASWMLKEIGTGGHRVTTANLEQLLKSQQDRARTADPVLWTKP